LSSQHKAYAAKDAFAGLALYNKIMEHPLPSPVSQDTPTGTQVQLLDQDGHRPAAIGILNCVSINLLHDKIRITKTRTIMEIQHVIIPGALLIVHGKKSLGSLSLPFEAVVGLGHIQTITSAEFAGLSDTTTHSDMDLDQPTSDMMELRNAEVAQSVQDELDAEEVMQDLIGDEETDGTILAFDSMINELGINFSIPDIGTLEVDEASHQEGCQIQSTMHQSSHQLVSRVLKDPFHVFNMLKIPKNHGLSHAFYYILSQTLFLDHPGD
jgi:hypothetical protein